MYVCYIDESGGFEAPNSDPSATPLMVLSGLIIRADRLQALTAEFLKIKKRYRPTEDTKLLDYILIEIKGAALRSLIRSGGHRKQRYALGVLDQVVSLVEKYDIRLVGRIWVKEVDKQLRPRECYTLSIQNIADHFNSFLQEKAAHGVILCDGRMPHQDSQVSHSIFTRKHRRLGDAYPSLLEAPFFSRSHNHVGLQLADIVASGMLFPIAARVYCAEDLNSVHTDSSFEILRYRYGTRLRSRQYFYKSAKGRRRGGVVVSDKLNKKPSKLLFQPPRMLFVEADRQSHIAASSL